MESKLPCYYALGGLNFKNGFATSCPIQVDQLHILDGTVPSEFWNNENFRDHRKKLMSGEWCNGCHLCKESEENSSTSSMRHDYAADETYYDFSSGAVDFKGLRHVELRFSNACNMACLHCSEVYSSKWKSRLKNYTPVLEDHANKLDQLTGAMHRANREDNLSIDLPLSEVEKIVDDLCKNFPNIEKIDFAGGEVLFQKQFFPCLEKLASHPNASNILITFHSNFNTKFDPIKLSKLLEPFADSHIKMSLDAGTNIYSYFRDGNWETLTLNLEKFKSVNNFTKLDVVCTTSVYQLMDLPNIFESMLTLDVQTIDASIVFTPEYLNPAIMMFEFSNEVLIDLEKCRNIITQRKQYLHANLEKYKQKYGYVDKLNHFNQIESAYKSIDRIEQYVLNHKPEYKHWESFNLYRKKIDILWKKNFNDAIVNYYIDVDGKIKRKELSMLQRLTECYNYVPYSPNMDFKTRSVNIKDEFKQKINEMQMQLTTCVNFITNKVDEDSMLDINNEMVSFIKLNRLLIDPISKQYLNKLDDLMKTHPADNRKQFRNKTLISQCKILKDFFTNEIEKLHKKLDSEISDALDLNGVLTHEIDGILIPLNPTWNKIAINLSGGADSACLAFTLAKIIQENNYNSTIDIITHVRGWVNRPWQSPISVDVYNKLKTLYPNIINDRIVNYIPPELEHGAIGSIADGQSGDQIIVQSFNDYIANQNHYDVIYNATTKNPSIETPTEDRMKKRDVNVDNIKLELLLNNNSSYYTCLPLLFVEKDWIIKQYYDNNLIELLHTTRSCEGEFLGLTNMTYTPGDKIEECGQCFWCVERKWAIEKEESRRAK